MSRAYERRELDVSQRVRYLEDDMDRSEIRHQEADERFEKIATSISNNQRVLISILASLIVAILMLTLNLAFGGGAGP